MIRLSGPPRTAAAVVSYVVSHPANRGKRARALVRAVRFQLRGRLLGRPTYTRVGQRMVMEARLHATGASKAVYANPPDYAEMMLWRRLIRPGDLFVDVGSNVGLYSLWAADCGAIPIAVEPDPLNAALTRENLALNNVDGEVHECALAGQPGTMRLTTGADTINHLLMDGAAAEGREVEVRTLDDVLDGRTVRGIKVDVEGAERLVIDGATETLRHQRAGVIQLEWNHLSRSLLGETRQPIVESLKSFGYRLARPAPRGDHLELIRPDDAGEEDAFAISPAVAAELGLR